MDSIILLPPGPSVAGSQLQLGTYLMADPGANYGAQGLLQSLRSGNALSDGGRFSFRYAPVRQMAIPLLLRDVPGQTLLQTETLLRRWTTAGAAVAVQPETIPSGQAVFFDILDGRWEPDYSTFENRVGRRKGTLFLDTQPFGYWPTEILLASAASIGNFGTLAVNGASMIGDAPALAHVIIAPTTASVFFPAPGNGSGWSADMLGISFAGKPSFQPFIGASSFVTSPLLIAAVASSLNDKYSPASVAKIYTYGNANNAWSMLFDTATAIPSALEPAYRGRFRVFMFARTQPSAALASNFMIVDADRFSPSLVANSAITMVAMASANQLATVYSVIPSGVAIQPSPNYSLLDMGEITLPPQGSGYQGGVRLRAWSLGAASQQISVGGLYLLPVDGAAGILTRGLYAPTISGGVPGIADFNYGFQESVRILQPMGASYQMVADGLANYHGLLPRVGASVNQLSIITGDRNVGAFAAAATFPVTQGGVEYAQVSVSYRPTFQFMYGL